MYGREVWREGSQARKGIRRMPRRSAAMKDAASCEKPWGAAGAHRTMDIRMGQPGKGNLAIPEGRPDPANRNIQVAGGREINRESPSSGERKGTSPNRRPSGLRGCGPREPEAIPAEAFGKMRQRGRDPRTRKDGEGRGIQSTTGHEEPSGKRGGPPSKAEHGWTTDSGSTVRER